jgi:hypothetical protein
VKTFSEQADGAVADVIMLLLLGNALAAEQNGMGAIHVLDPANEHAWGISNGA